MSLSRPSGVASANGGAVGDSGNIYNYINGSGPVYIFQIPETRGNGSNFSSSAYPSQSVQERHERQTRTERWVNRNGNRFSSETTGYPMSSPFVHSAASHPFNGTGEQSHFHQAGCQHHFKARAEDQHSTVSGFDSWFPVTGVHQPFVNYNNEHVASAAGGNQPPGNSNNGPVMRSAGVNPAHGTFGRHHYIPRPLESQHAFMGQSEILRQSENTGCPHKSKAVSAERHYGVPQVVHGPYTIINSNGNHL